MTSQNSRAVIKKENNLETRKKKSLENYMRIYFKILHLIRIRTQNTEEDP